MTALVALAGQAAGGTLLASAALDGIAVINGRRRTGVFARARASVARLATRYNTSHAGRRLADGLDAASILVTPARWRAGQLVALPPLIALVALAGVPVGWGFAVASLAVRVGARVYLRARRDRRDDELVDAAAILARHLATELASGSTAAEAIASPARSRDVSAERRLEALLSAASARSAAGDAIAPALYGAVAELPAGRGRDALALLATELELVVERGCGTAVLTRLASGIEERRQTVAEVRAASAEIRMATLAIPSMAAGVALLLVLSDHAVAAAALSPVGAVVGVCLGGVATGAVVVARRLTSPWEHS